MKGKALIFLLTAGGFLVLAFCRGRKPCTGLTVAGETGLLVLHRMGCRLRRRLVCRGLCALTGITVLLRLCKKLWERTAL